MINSNLKIILLLFLSTGLLAGIDCNAQNNIIYRHHFLNHIFVNPAMSGSEFFPVINLSYNKQWLGINQSPQTMIASTSLRLGNFDFYNPKKFINKTGLKTGERIGMGAGIYFDHNGPLSTSGINLAYSYHVPFEHSRLSFGLSVNGEQSLLDETNWKPVDPNDPIIGNVKERLYSFNANFGSYFYTESYFAGLAVNHLIPLKDKTNPGEIVKQDFMVNAGYLFLKNENIKIEPSIYIRWLDYSDLELDIQGKIYLNHVNWISVIYRSYKALAVMAGFKINQFYLAYSFETNLSPVIKYNAGTHGLNLGMNLGIRRLEGF